MIRLDRQSMKDCIFSGKFGLEKENLRVDTQGFIAKTKHPFPKSPYIERDFCENQIEMITPVCDSIEQVHEVMKSLHGETAKALLTQPEGAEYLWPFSNPPYITTEADIPIATYSGRDKHKEEYRRQLAAKHGKKKMLFSGIHFNFSYSEEILKRGYEASSATDFTTYSNQVYLELSKQLTKYAWLIVYLMAASPVMDGSFFQPEARGQDVVQNYASVRCSEVGYWNDFIPLLIYDNLDTYAESIARYVENGRLISAAELYYPIRLKPAGAYSMENLRQNGVDHIEIRTLDLNPLTPVGIFGEDLQFLHLLILYLTSLPDEEFGCYEQMMAIRNEKRAATYEDNLIWIETGWNQTRSIEDAGMEVLGAMETFFMDYEDYENIKACLRRQEEKLLNPAMRYAARIRKQYQRNYVTKGLVLAKEYAEYVS